MRRSSLILITLLGAALLAVAPTPPARAAVQTGFFPLQSPGAPSPGWIRADDSFVVWSEHLQVGRARRFANLYAASLESPQPVQLAAELAFGPYFGPLSPGFDVDSGVAVWVNQSDTDQSTQGILAQDLRSGRRWTVTEARAGLPVIDGSLVAWWEDLGWDGATPAQEARLMLRDIGTMDAPRTLVTIAAPKDYLIRSLRISQRWAVWVQGTFDNGEKNQPCWRLLAVAVGGGPTRTVTELGCDERYKQLAIDLSGSRVAYNDQDNQLVIHDLDNDTQQVSGPHDNREPVWAGQLLFWSALGDGQGWGYDPASDSAFPLGGSRMNWPLAGSSSALAWFSSLEGEQFGVQVRPLAELTPAAPRTAAEATSAGRTFFAPTGHTLGGAFRDFWQASGGLPVFGYPLTEEFVQRLPGSDQGYTVQYLERQRFELHQENGGTPYLVLLGRLGAEALAASGRDWQQFPKAQPTAPHYIRQTGQAIDPLFWEYWRNHGLELGDPGVSEREALALWGYPLSPLQQETPEGGATRMVQWFERARFEYHPENRDPYKVLLGRLAAEQVERFDWE